MVVVKHGSIARLDDIDMILYNRVCSIQSQINFERSIAGK